MVLWLSSGELLCYRSPSHLVSVEDCQYELVNVGCWHSLNYRDDTLLKHVKINHDESHCRRSGQFIMLLQIVFTV